MTQVPPLCSRISEQGPRSSNQRLPYIYIYPLYYWPRRSHSVPTGWFISSRGNTGVFLWTSLAISKLKFPPDPPLLHFLLFWSSTEVLWNAESHSGATRSTAVHKDFYLLCQFSSLSTHRWVSQVFQDCIYVQLVTVTKLKMLLSWVH